MATFEAEVEVLTGITIDTSGTVPTRNQLSQFLSDASVDILNSLPQDVVAKYATDVQTLNNSTTKMDTVGHGPIVGVFRLDADSGGVDKPCRLVPVSQRGQVQDSNDMNFATASDPVYLYYDEQLEVYPTPTANQTARILYNDYVTIDANTDISGLSQLPQGALRLYALYGAYKTLQANMARLIAGTGVSTALGLIKTAVDQAATAASKFLSADSDSVFGDEATFLTSDSQLTRVKDALDNAEKIIDDGANSPTGNSAGDAASYLYTDEDTELLNGALSIASSEINRAQAHLSEWNAIGDMRVKEVNTALSEAQGYANEVQARLADNASRYDQYSKLSERYYSEYKDGLANLR